MGEPTGVKAMPKERGKVLDSPEANTRLAVSGDSEDSRAYSTEKDGESNELQ